LNRRLVENENWSLGHRSMICLSHLCTTFNERRRSTVGILLAATEPIALGWLSPKHFSINENRKNSDLDHYGPARINVAP
jgi:hypothetical protein